MTDFRTIETCTSPSTDWKRIFPNCILTHGYKTTKQLETKIEHFRQFSYWIGCMHLHDTSKAVDHHQLNACAKHQLNACDATGWMCSSVLVSITLWHTKHCKNTPTQLVAQIPRLVTKQTQLVQIPRLDIKGVVGRIQLHKAVIIVSNYDCSNEKSSLE